MRTYPGILTFIFLLLMSCVTGAIMGYTLSDYPKRFLHSDSSGDYRDTRIAVSPPVLSPGDALCVEVSAPIETVLQTATAKIVNGNWEKVLYQNTRPLPEKVSSKSERRGESVSYEYSLPAETFTLDMVPQLDLRPGMTFQLELRTTASHADGGDYVGMQGDTWLYELVWRPRETRAVFQIAVQQPAWIWRCWSAEILLGVVFLCFSLWWQSRCSLVPLRPRLVLMFAVGIAGSAVGAAARVYLDRLSEGRIMDRYEMQSFIAFALGPLVMLVVLLVWAWARSRATAKAGAEVGN